MQIDSAWDRRKELIYEYRDQFVPREEGFHLIKDTMLSDIPTHVVSFGDGECMWLFYRELKEHPLFQREDFPYRREWSSRWSGSAGLDPEVDRCLEDRVIESIRSSPILCSQFYWTKMELLASLVLMKYGLFGFKKAVDLNLMYQLNARNCFFPMIDGRKVLIVGGISELVAAKMVADDFVESNRSLGIVEGYEIVGHITTPWRKEPKSPHLDRILSDVSSYDFDIALLACGAVSLVIADFVTKELGRRSFDIGAVDRSILGMPRRGFHDRSDFNTPDVPRWCLPREAS